MKRLLSVIVLAALLSTTAFAAIYPLYKTPINAPRRFGVERVAGYDPRVQRAVIDTLNAQLLPIDVPRFAGSGRGGYAPFYPRGTARIRATTWYGYPRSNVVINTKDLDPSDRINKQFEAWLIDDDTGYRLSMGTFTTLFGGTGKLNYRLENSIAAYDRIEVTVEPYDDLDTAPGPVVLMARIPPFSLPGSFYNPPASQRKINTGVFSQY